MSQSDRRRNIRDEAEKTRLEESKRALETAQRDSETIGSSSMARTAQRVAGHFMASEEDGSDPAELWGKRIGRALALIVVALLVYHLVTTYILPPS